MVSTQTSRKHQRKGERLVGLRSRGSSSDRHRPRAEGARNGHRWRLGRQTVPAKRLSFCVY